MTEFHHFTSRSMSYGLSYDRDHIITTDYFDCVTSLHSMYIKHAQEIAGVPLK